MRRPHPNLPILPPEDDEEKRQSPLPLGGLGWGRLFAATNSRNPNHLARNHFEC